MSLTSSMIQLVDAGHSAVVGWLAEHGSQAVLCQLFFRIGMQALAGEGWRGRGCDF